MSEAQHLGNTRNHTKIERCVFDTEFFGLDGCPQAMEPMLIFDDSSMDDENAQEYCFKNGLGAIDISNQISLEAS